MRPSSLPSPFMKEVCCCFYHTQHYKYETWQSLSARYFLFSWLFRDRMKEALRKKKPQQVPDELIWTTYGGVSLQKTQSNLMCFPKPLTPSPPFFPTGVCGS
uniref:Uncharacterized protein n=1 Tax=Micrurus lemniscatus lemniscatus TaxID=129467 RepID=A0A2D4I217_MICLE